LVSIIPLAFGQGSYPVGRFRGRGTRLLVAFVPLGVILEPIVFILIVCIILIITIATHLLEPVVPYFARLIPSLVFKRRSQGRERLRRTD
jgi:hypothetical protein